MSWAPPSGPPPSFPAPPGAPGVSPQPFQHQELYVEPPAGFRSTPSPSMPTVGLPGASPIMPVAQPSATNITTYLGTEIYIRQAPPSLVGYDPRQDATALQKLKGDKLVEKLGKMLPGKPFTWIQVLDGAYAAITKAQDPLHKAAETACGGKIDGFEWAVLLLAKGPLEGDAWLLTLPDDKLSADPVKRLSFFVDILIGRTGEDIATLRSYIRATRHIEIDDRIRKQIALLDAYPAQQVYIQYAFKVAMEQKAQITDDHEDLAALKEIFLPQSKSKERREKLADIILGRSPRDLRRLSDLFERDQDNYGTRLVQALETYFQARPSDAIFASLLIYAINNVSDPNGTGSKVTASRLHDTMKGMGTRESLLATRVVRGHWDGHRWFAALEDYEKTYGHRLEKDMKDELTGLFSGSTDKNLYDTLKALSQ